MQTIPKPKRKRGCWLYLLAFLALSAIFSLFSPDETAEVKTDPTTTPAVLGSVQTLEPTFAAEDATFEAILAATPVPTKTRTPKPSATPKPTQDPRSDLGMRSGNLTAFLKELGFDCTGVSESKDGVLSWSCDKTGASMGLHVEMYSHSFDLEYIEATETGTSPTASTGFLALLAGEINADAGDWVQTTLVSGASDASKDFAGVPFHIMTSAQAQVLEIGFLPE